MNKDKIYITGYEGNVGSELVKRGFMPFEANITSRKAVNIIKSKKPEVIIHCAALTNVDYCEEHPDEAFEINVRGTLNLIDQFDGCFIYLSTDHVFSGNEFNLYREFHPTIPVNKYGMSKFIGEQCLNWTSSGVKGVIVRTSKLFTDEDISTIVDKLTLGETFEVTQLIKRTFLYIPHFVDGLIDLLGKVDRLGEDNIVHISGLERSSYYEFYKKIAQCYGLQHSCMVSRGYELKDVTPRPLRGGLNCTYAKQLGIPLYSDWDGLEAITGESITSRYLS